MEKKQGKIGREGSKIDDGCSDAARQYKKERAKMHEADSGTYTSPEAESSTKRYHRDNLEADRLNRIGETGRVEERNILMQRGERSHERQDGLDH